jgi:hypothetical protein
VFVSSDIRNTPGSIFWRFLIRSHRPKKINLRIPASPMKLSREVRQGNPSVLNYGMKSSQLGGSGLHRELILIIAFLECTGHIEMLPLIMI